MGLVKQNLSPLLKIILEVLQRLFKRYCYKIWQDNTVLKFMQHCRMPVKLLQQNFVEIQLSYSTPVEECGGTIGRQKRDQGQHRIPKPPPGPGPAVGDVSASPVPSSLSHVVLSLFVWTPEHLLTVQDGAFVLGIPERRLPLPSRLPSPLPFPEETSLQHASADHVMKDKA
ncbi:hypothetical protein MC885_011909, partial [Smutsia gigantea]